MLVPFATLLTGMRPRKGSGKPENKCNNRHLRRLPGVTRRLDFAALWTHSPPVFGGRTSCLRFPTFRCWCGAVAQLGERVVRNDEVSGSIPLSSTIPASFLNIEIRPPLLAKRDRFICLRASRRFICLRASRAGPLNSTIPAFARTAGPYAGTSRAMRGSRMGRLTRAAAAASPASAYHIQS